MKLFVSKLSLEKAGNPKGKKIYVAPCKFYDGEKEDENIIGECVEELEEPVEDEEGLMPLNMKDLIKEFRNGRLRQGWG